MLPEAVLFDMDGLLVDTEPQWFAAEAATVRELGADWGKQQQADLLGSNLQFASQYMRDYTGTQRSLEEITSLLLDNMTRQLLGGVTFRAGAVNLLEQLSAAHVPMGMVTSSVRAHAAVVLEQLPQPFFEHVVTADDVERYKPDPLPYLRGLELMGAQPHLTVVLEDSPNGVAAAQAAGCRVLGIPSVVALQPSEHVTVRSSLHEVTVDLLAELVTPS